VALPGPVIVLGTGAIGSYLGGCLQAAGVEVHFVGRAVVCAELRAMGLRLSDLDGRDTRLAPDALHLHESMAGAAAAWAGAAARAAPLVLLCVKSAATATAAREAAAALPAGTLMLSCQNGIDNAAIAQREAPGLRVRAGVVAFNVAHLAAGHWHRGTSGELAVQGDAAWAGWQAAFAAAGLPLRVHADLRAVQWGKLLLNLNNPVNALSGQPLKAQLLDRGHRRVLAALQAEALQAMRAAGIAPARLAPLPPAWVPVLLRLPTPLFRRLAARMLRIDERARSSMADDLVAGRTTEVDALCGAVVRLAEAHGLAAPHNARMGALIEAAVRARADTGVAPGGLGGAALCQRMGL
jgi:2-dehydropantoate 2-reductase